MGSSTLSAGRVSRVEGCAGVSIKGESDSVRAGFQLHIHGLLVRLGSLFDRFDRRYQLDRGETALHREEFRLVIGNPLQGAKAVPTCIPG